MAWNICGALLDAWSGSRYRGLTRYDVSQCRKSLGSQILGGRVQLLGAF